MDKIDTIYDLFTVVKAVGIANYEGGSSIEVYLLLPPGIKLDTESGMKLAVSALKDKLPSNNNYIFSYRIATPDEVKISDLSLSEYAFYRNSLKMLNII